LGETSLRLLCLLAGDPQARELTAGELAARLRVTERAVDGAMAELEALSVPSVSVGDTKAARAVKKETPREPKPQTEKKTKVSELPSYTDAEFASLLEKRRELSDLITEAQNTLGKIFSVNETKILVSIAEEFGFDEEFLLVLLDFCRRNDRKSMRYIEKLAVSLYDSNIRTTAALTEHLHRREALESAQERVRSIFGIGSRALTSKEKDFIAKWTETYQFEFAMIEKAYEITVNATSKPSLSYTNKILESWYSEGLKTPEAVDAATAKRSGEKPQGMSFDVDEFFKAALERSYRDDKK
ncbi:MAG: DnaD domain protein, partial [Clostridia bacterium]|nr:DnaD domain protein [Clostridia bacterium]